MWAHTRSVSSAVVLVRLGHRRDNLLHLPEPFLPCWAYSLKVVPHASPFQWMASSTVHLLSHNSETWLCCVAVRSVEQLLCWIKKRTSACDALANCLATRIFALLQVQRWKHALHSEVIVSCNSPRHLISLDNSCSSCRRVGICYLLLNSGSRRDNIFLLDKVFLCSAVTL